MRAPQDFKPFPKEEVEQSIPERFEKIVAQGCERVAIQVRGASATYGEINAMANRIARRIVADHGQKSTPICVIMEKGVQLTATMMGILKGGNFFVLLDPSFPKARIEEMINEAGVELVLTNQNHSTLAGNIAKGQVHVVQVESIIQRGNAENLKLYVPPNKLALLYHTSGSTGRPKQVMQTHQSILHAVMSRTNAYHISSDDRISLLSSGTAQMVTNIFMALLNGALLVSFDVRNDGVAAMIQWLGEEKISVCWISVPLFRKACEALTGHETFPDLRLIRLGSEGVLRTDIELYRKHFSRDCLLANGLNSSETGLLRNYLIDQNCQFPGNQVPVGYAIEDKDLLLLDDDGNEVGVNQVGEMVVRSKYLSPGYWNNPELTQAKFKPDPKGGAERLYFTGDLGLLLPDGRLIHKGRKDFRVKIRGYGVDLPEVEQTLLRHHSIREVAVVPRKNEVGDGYLVAYFTTVSTDIPSTTELRRFLAEKLADYMIPAQFLKLEDLPRTPSGKIDRKAFIGEKGSRPKLESDYVAPQTKLQEKLVRIWEESLGVRPIGIHDNFFDLGGHSLAAASVLAKVKQEFYVDLPIGIFVKAAEIEKLAKQVELERDNSLTKKWSYLFQLEPGDGRSPVFFLPGGIGGDNEFFVYARLVRHVGGEHAFFGLKARSAQGTLPSQASVEEIAADYLHEMRSLQPVGPYYILGECAGGILAYEIAQQLQTQGQEIALLILMDTPRPDLSLEVGRRLRRRFRPILESRFIKGLGFLAQQLRERSFKEEVSYLAGKRAKLISWLVSERQISRPRGVGNPLESVQRSYSRAIYRYRPKPYSGKMILLVHEETERTDPTLGWKDFVSGGIEVCEVAGNHNTYIRDYVQKTAEKLREYLDAAQLKALVLYSLGLETINALCDLQQWTVL